MRTIEAYFLSVRQLIANVEEARVERYEEQLLTPTRGNLRIQLRFADDALLEISEAIVFTAGEPQWLSYRYHYQVASARQIFRYDNAPHHAELPSHPEHKHMEDRVLASSRPSIEHVLHEVQRARSQSERP